MFKLLNEYVLRSEIDQAVIEIPVSHTTLTDIGSNTHTAIDAHIATASGNPHSVTHAETGVTSDQHHAKSHAHNGTDGSGTVSHTDLDDIGTNTHAQIDTHVASTSDPHDTQDFLETNGLASLNVGDVSGGDYAKIETDGSVQLFGDGTMWKDMIADLFGRRLYSTAGKVDYDYDENALDFQSGGSISTTADRVGGNLEINHEFLVGTSITFKPHIHWFQDASTAYELTMRYRLQRNNAVKTTTWTSVTLTAGTDDVYTYPGSGVFNQLSRFPDITITCGISDTIQFQVARTDSLGGNMLVYFMDLHGEVDAFGSRAEIVK